MRILVTGGTGFIGQHVVDKLVEKKHEIICLVKNSDRARDILGHKVEYFEGDITNYDSIKTGFDKIDAVVHLASFARDYGRPRDFWDVNVLGTGNVLKAANNASVKRFIHLSTVTVMGPYPEQFADEHHHYEKTGVLFSDTKIEAEKLVLEYHHKHKLNTTIIRPGIVYGPGNCPFILFPIRLAKRKIPMFISGGKGICNHTYVENLSEAISISLIKDAARGKIYIITDGINQTTWKKFLTRIYYMAGIKKIYISIPSVIAYPLAYIFDAISRIIPVNPPITPLMVYLATNKSMYSIEAAKNDLDFVPRIQLVEGLNNTADYLMDNNII